ncbi:AAA domain-containing protein [Polychytrium aggregatum]|uniref:AAA domain-containing protein n=1 Tax=Polychytrium aggregatum TaxID=110093 RepID=UPI0022FDD61D|nr:AAA domain-containing protein [Polychytrium aggregatum]KAI9203660.1 AAA domain-containing protein [Polychytrium aggregatum]
MPPRKYPNILITGTPGCGKTTTCELAAIATGLTHLEVGKLVKERGLHDGFDDEFQSWILDEDKVVDELEPEMQQGGRIVDHHGADFFPERWFDLVVVLRADTQVLFGRLEQRGYSSKKIEENMECEIMQVVLDEARESYRPEIVVELPSNTVEDMENNVERIESWVTQFVQERSE